ncbi:MAG TPA: HD domain-containing protein [Smithella sp.]|nr:HD domain-containing protein [Smithella sp.]HNY50577.1 HD domain-containing protein [Smithella sp.]HOG90299.1 HD domain-containing protein [Smithella sp.]
MRVTQRIIGPKFQEAILYAVEIHGGDLRKSTTIPYISHLFSVCALVLEDGGDEEEAIAALLHDMLEDHPKEVTKQELERRFGSRVAEIVAVCTDTPPNYKGGPKPPWRKRKAAYIDRLREEKYPRCRVPLADKLHNVRTIVNDYRRIGNDIWARFKATKKEQLRYHRSLVEAFREANGPAYLVDELDKLVAELEMSDKSA